MVTLRKTRCTVAWCAAWLAGACVGTGAQLSPDWRPTREVAPPAKATSLQAAILLPTAGVQVDGHPVVIPRSIPFDSITDAELDRMRVGCCDDVFAQPYDFSPPADHLPYLDPMVSRHGTAVPWQWELLPGDLIWKSYWAGTKEPRISGTFFQDTSDNLSLFDVTLGGRSSLARYATSQGHRPEGWEIQLEGAGMLRLNLDQNWDFEAADFRFGVPLIYAAGHVQWKFAYYHLSSHVGDEFLKRNPTFQRINFSRDTLVAGLSYFPLPAVRAYAEAGWAFYADEGTDPWEFQFGVDMARPGPTGRMGTPFIAVNGHLREEVNFGGNLVIQAGCLWRGKDGQSVRAGLHYLNGKSNQFEFFNNSEQQIGFGVWQDF